MATSKIGVNITSEAINDYFTTLKPAPPQQVHQNALKQGLKIHDPAAIHQRINQGKTPEERRTSGSRDLYHILTDPSRNEDFGYYNFFMFSKITSP